MHALQAARIITSSPAITMFLHHYDLASQDDYVYPKYSNHRDLILDAIAQLDLNNMLPLPISICYNSTVSS